MGSHVLCTEIQDWDTQNNLTFSLPGQGFACVDFLLFFPDPSQEHKYQPNSFFSILLN